MVYKIISNEDEELNNLLEFLMNDLNYFFKINWTQDKPNIFIVRNREIINKILRKETPLWWVGWSEGKNIFLLDKESFEKESSHRYKLKEYEMLIKHELVHCYCNILFPQFRRPLWLREGLAVFLSDQNKLKEIPEKYEKFLDYFEEGGKSLYSESGFSVGCLINKFGSPKILELLKKSGNVKSKEHFDEIFEEVYRFRPTYDNFNNLSKIISINEK